MSGRVIYRNMMSILMLGVNTVAEERTSQLHGPFLEDAVQLCLQLFLLALTKDALFAEHWRPVYQVRTRTHASFCLIAHFVVIHVPKVGSGLYEITSGEVIL